jgi:hypothetical protein
VTIGETVLLVAIALAVFGAGSVVADAAYAGGERRFVAYLVALLLSLAAVGCLLLAAV